MRSFICPRLLTAARDDTVFSKSESLKGLAANLREFTRIFQRFAKISVDRQTRY